jgi:hypothetical protein
LSLHSDAITLFCAFIPDPPTSVTTTNTLDKVVVAWSDPETNGSPITGYKIYVQEKISGEFTEESVECDGSLAETVSRRQCTISLDTLKAVPYSLIKDDPVNVRVVSQNVYGDSAQSDTGSGAVI